MDRNFKANESKNLAALLVSMGAFVIVNWPAVNETKASLYTDFDRLRRSRPPPHHP